MTTWVFDPGHGGDRQVGSSRPNQVVGPRGVREKDIVLALAIATRAAMPAGANVVLTRDRDRNLGLADRIDVAVRAGAGAFVSMHLSGSADPRQQGTATFVHRDAGQRSVGLAHRVQRAVVSVTEAPDLGVRRAPLAVLDPTWHSGATAACLLEASFLSNPDEELRLRDRAYRGAIARGLAEALTEHALSDASFDVLHVVPLVPQITGMSCWAAAAAMLVGWRHRLWIAPDQVARLCRRQADCDDGLRARDVNELARMFDLIVVPPGLLGPREFRSLLERHGPLWVGHADPDLHVVVMVGIYGDGTPEGTWVRINDPWPIGQGERYQRRFAEWMVCFAAAHRIGGVHAQLLHAKGRSNK